MDIAGDIPDMLKTKGAEKQAVMAMKMIKLIRDRDM